MLKDTNWMNEI